MIEELSPMQCRMGRAALAWTASELAKQSSVGVTTISRFESGLTSPTRATLAAMRRALEAAGVEFIPENGGGAGVRMKERSK